jgi:hypothetical protein
MEEGRSLKDEGGNRNRAERDRLERSDSRVAGSPEGEIKPSGESGCLKLTNLKLKTLPGLVSGSKNRIARFTRNAGLPLVLALFTPAVAQHLDRNGGRRLLSGSRFGAPLLGYIGGCGGGGRCA